MQTENNVCETTCLDDKNNLVRWWKQLKHVDRIKLFKIVMQLRTLLVKQLC
jgi:hypothetical protein